jgi:hypothetical protein
MKVIGPGSFAASSFLQKPESVSPPVRQVFSIGGNEQQGSTAPGFVKVWIRPDLFS